MTANEREPETGTSDAPNPSTDEQVSQERARLVERKQTIERGPEILPSQDTSLEDDANAPSMTESTQAPQQTAMMDQATMTWEDALAILSAPPVHSPTIDSEYYKALVVVETKAHGWLATYHHAQPEAAPATRPREA